METAPIAIINCVLGSLTLIADGEELELRYDLGDTEISGLVKGPPVVRFTEYLIEDQEGVDTHAHQFVRRHPIVDIRLQYDLEIGQRDIVVHGCRLDDVAYREADNGNRMLSSFVGERVTGNLLALTRPTSLATIPMMRRGQWVGEIPSDLLAAAFSSQRPTDR